MTLAQAAFGQQTLLKQSILAVGGAFVVAMAAQISIGAPVPMSLQTLAILLVGMSFGAKLGATTLLTYLGLGAAGLPVFANAMNGAAFFGPTAGFLVGFVGMAFLAGLLTDRGIRNAVVLALGGIAISALLYVPGVAWAMGADMVFGLDASKWGADSLASIWKWYMAPFLIGDVIKAILAAMIVAGGASLLSKKAR